MHEVDFHLHRLEPENMIHLPHTPESESYITFSFASAKCTSNSLSSEHLVYFRIFKLLQVKSTVYSRFYP